MIIRALVLLMVSTTAQAGLYDEHDKIQHTTYSAVGANTFKMLGMSTVESFTTMVLIGLGKEMLDNNSSNEHRRDMVANVIGASTVFVWEIKF